MLYNFILEKNDSSFHIEESKTDIKYAKKSNNILSPILDQSVATPDQDFSLYEIAENFWRQTIDRTKKKLPVSISIAVPLFCFCIVILIWLHKNYSWKSNLL